MTLTYEPTTNGANSPYRPIYDQMPVVVDDDSMPALPEAARVDYEAGEDACHWLDIYVKYAETEAPASYAGYHSSVGLWVLSTTAARRVAVRPERNTTIFSGLYIGLGGESSLYGKTTAALAGVEVVQALTRSKAYQLLHDGRVTPNKFISNMGLTVPDDYGRVDEGLQAVKREALAFTGQRGWYIDELGRRLRYMTSGRGPYAELYELLLEIYNTPDRVTLDTIKRGAEVAHLPYLALLGNVTPANLRVMGSQDSESWSDGFFPRFVWVWPPDGTRPQQGRWSFAEEASGVPDEVLQPLTQWHGRLGLPEIRIVDEADGLTDGNGKPLPPQWQAEVGHYPVQYLQVPHPVQNAFYAYHHALQEIAYQRQRDGGFHLAASYTRLASHALKAAMLMASVNGQQAIGKAQWIRAQTMAEQWRDSLHVMTGIIDRGPTSETARKQERVLQAMVRLQLDGEEATSRALCRKLTMRSAELAETLEPLIKRQLVEAVPMMADNGRQYTRYLLAKSV